LGRKYHGTRKNRCPNPGGAAGKCQADGLKSPGNEGRGEGDTHKIGEHSSGDDKPPTHISRTCVPTGKKKKEEEMDRTQTPNPRSGFAQEWGRTRHARLEEGGGKK